MTFCCRAGQQVHQVPRDCVACPALGVKTVRMASQDHEDLLGCQAVPDSLETLAGKVPLAPRERRVLVDGQVGHCATHSTLFALFWNLYFHG